MVSITSRTEYGVIALLDMVENHGGELVQIRDIVKRRKIPRHYLEQILNVLVKKGIVKSVRGNKGGYALNTAPGDVTLLQIIEALEGKVKIGGNIKFKALRVLFSGLESEAVRVFGISLDAFAAQQGLSGRQVMYHI